MAQFIAGILSGTLFMLGTTYMYNLLVDKKESKARYKSSLFSKFKIGKIPTKICKVVLALFSCICIVVSLVTLYLIISTQNSDYWVLFNEVLNKLFKKP